MDVKINNAVNTKWDKGLSDVATAGGGAGNAWYSTWFLWCVGETFPINSWFLHSVNFQKRLKNNRKVESDISLCFFSTIC